MSGSQAELEQALAAMAEEGAPAILDHVAALEAMARTFLGSPGRARSTQKTAPLVRAPRAVRPPEAILLVDGVGTIRSADGAVDRVFGWRADELVGRSVELLAPPEEGGSLLPRDGQLARRRDGTSFVVDLTVGDVEVAGQRLHVLVVRDGSSRRAAEEANERANARYRMLVEQIPAVTFMAALDESENEIYIGPQIEALLGYTQQEWLDDPVLWYWRMHPEDRARWNEEFSRGIQTGGPFRNECRFFARDGRTVWVHGEARVVRGADGRPLFVQGLAFDITEQKRAEERIREAQSVVVRTERLAAVGQLAAGVAHDLRNPLGAIRNAWHFLSRKAGLKGEGADARIRQMAEIVDQELGRCAQIIGDLLDFSRSRPPFLVPVPLHELWAEAQRVVVRAHADTALVDALPRDLPVPNVDRHQLRQVLVNLLQNAAEVVPARGGRVVVTGHATTHAGAPAVVLDVIDNGPGVPPEARERVFEPLFTTKLKGTGLGLAVVQTFVRRHGGDVTVVEQASGSGATFRIVLPIGEPSRGEAPATGGAADLRA